MLKRLDLVLLMVFVFLGAFFTYQLCPAAQPPPPPSWVEHMDIVAPMIRSAVWAVFKVVACLFGTIIMLAGIILRYWWADWKKAHKKIDVVYNIMTNCDGCAAAAEKYGRRATDILIDGDRT